MSATKDKGTWVENRDTPGYSLFTTAGKIQYDVTVEGAQRPIPVIAANINDVKAVLKAHGLKYVSASRVGEVLGLHDSMKVTPAKTAIAAFKASDAETAEKTAVKEQIAEQAAAPVEAAPAENSRDDIDTLLDAAADPVKVEPKPGEKASEAVKRTAAEQRQATPDPKPSQAAKGKGKGAGKGRASRPTTSAEKAAARKASTPAGKRAASKPAETKAATTPAADKRAAERQQVIDLFNDPKFAEGTTGAARRKAIAEKMPQFKGRVNGILTAAGVKQ